MGKIALVTGARSGIGAAVAAMLLEKDYTVYGSSRSEQADCGINFVTMDVMDDRSVESALSSILAREGGVDVLVNNAGNAVVGPLAKSSADDLRKQLDVNLFGVHRVISALLPAMLERGGTIVNIGSLGGRLALPYQGLYSASKAALAMYTDALRMELFSSKVRVCLVEPGDTKTDFDDGRIPSELYDPDKDVAATRAIDIMRAAESKGSDARVVADAVWRAIEAKRPRPRYLTGPDAKGLGLLLRFLPHSVQERLLMMNYKVPRK